MKFLNKILIISIFIFLNNCSGTKEKEVLLIETDIEAQMIQTYKEGLDENYYEVFDEIGYQNNIAIIFLNSLDALHCVTPREPTAKTRTFMNLVGEMPYDIFTKYTYGEKILINTKAKLKRMIYKKL